MVPKEGVQYPAIIKLLWHFRWTLVGLVGPDTDIGERFMRSLMTLLVRNGICAVFSQKFPVGVQKFRLDTSQFVKWAQATVFVYYAEMDNFIIGIIIMYRIIEICIKAPIGNVWIISALWDFTLYFQYTKLFFSSIYGYISFLIQTDRHAQYEDMSSIRYTVHHVMDKVFPCYYFKHGLSVKGWRRCPEKENLEILSQKKIEEILSLDNYVTYHSIWTVVRALHDAYSSRSKRKVKNNKHILAGPELQPWEVFPLRNFIVQFFSIFNCTFIYGIDYFIQSFSFPDILYSWAYTVFSIYDIFSISFYFSYFHSVFNIFRWLLSSSIS